MKQIILCALLLGAGGVVWGQAVAPQPAVAATAPTLADLKKQFETAMRDAQKANREALKTLRQVYSDTLTTFQTELQAKGEMQAVLVIRDEKTRFEQAGDIPAALAVEEPLDDVVVEHDGQLVLVGEQFRQPDLVDVGGADKA